MKNKFNYLLTLILLALGLGVSSQAWAYTINNAKVYYDPTAAGWGSGKCTYIQIFIDKGTDDWGNSGMSMSHITNTNLWFWTGSWGDDKVSHLRFATTDSGDWGWYAKQSSWDRLNTNEHCCGVDNGAQTDVNNQHKLFTSTGTAKGASITETTLSGYGALNKKQTVIVMISTDNGSTYTEATTNWHNNTIKANRFTMTADNTASSSQKDLAVGDEYNYANAVITSSITFTANPNSNFTFAGWSESNAGPDNDKKDASYTYTVSGTKTIYAYFNEKVSTITLVGCTAASTTAGPITTGTATAKEPAGKEVTNFTAEGGASLVGYVAPAKSANFNATAAGTVTAVFGYLTPSISVASTATYQIGGAAIKLNPTYTDVADDATYAWTCTSVTPTGESGATVSDCKFSATNIANPNVSATKAGEYTIQITVSQGGKSDSETITLTVNTATDKCATCFTQTGSTPTK